MNFGVDINVEMKDVASWIQVCFDTGLLASKDGDYMCVHKYMCTYTEEDKD